MAKVYMFIGKIASGKTHAAMTIKQRQPLMLLSCDDLMLTLFDRCLGDQHRETEDNAFRFLWGQALQLAEMGIDSALDGGFWTRDSRQAARKFFAANGVDTVWVYCNPPEPVRLERLEQRNHDRAAAAGCSGQRAYIIPEDTRQRLDSQFEPPSPEEYDMLIEE